MWTSTDIGFLQKEAEVLRRFMNIESSWSGCLGVR